jgi:hypothetical protein
MTKSPECSRAGQKRPPLRRCARYAAGSSAHVATHSRKKQSTVGLAPLLMAVLVSTVYPEKIAKQKSRMHGGAAERASWPSVGIPGPHKNGQRALRERSTQQSGCTGDRRL